jgi:hypothetical protein
LTETLRERRAEQVRRDWKAEYALRSGVEGTIRQDVAVQGRFKVQVILAVCRPSDAG